MFFSKDDSEKLGKEVIKNLYYFSENQMFDCNQYIIEDSNTGDLSVFDAGNAISLEGLIKGMEKLELDYRNITKIFLTHEHVDHILGIYKLLNILKNNPPEIYAYGKTVEILEKGEERKILPVMFGLTAKHFGIKIVPLQVNNLRDLKEIEISSDFIFEVYHTPGHSLGSVCYYAPEKKALIPGDLIFIGGSFGRYDFPGGSLPTLIKSIKFVNNLDIKYLLPGHMGISENGNKSVELSYRMIKTMNSFY
ncbi:MAG: MBL fold metallo-hydrolase [Candidatus Thorarchaeota archaeon]